MKHNAKLKTLWRLFLIFFKAGTFTFAGGLAMLPMISRDVKKYQMLEEEKFLEYIALAQSLPGVIGINSAVFVGNAVAGVPGAIAGGLGTAIPAFAAMLAATILLRSIPREGWVEGAFKGVRAASAALILGAAWTLGQKAIKGVFAIAVALACFALIVFLNISAFPVILAAGAAGIAYAYVLKKRNKPATTGKSPAQDDVKVERETEEPK